MPETPAPIPTPEPAKPTPVLAIQITLLSDGNVSISGPLEKPELMMKMMGTALAAASEFAQRKDGARLVQAAGPGAMRLLNGRA